MYQKIGHKKTFDDSPSNSVEMRKKMREEAKKKIERRKKYANKLRSRTVSKNTSINTGIYSNKSSKNIKIKGKRNILNSNNNGNISELDKLKHEIERLNKEKVELKNRFYKFMVGGNPKHDKSVSNEIKWLKQYLKNEILYEIKKDNESENKLINRMNIIYTDLLILCNINDGNINKESTTMIDIVNKMENMVQIMKDDAMKYDLHETMNEM